MKFTIRDDDVNYFTKPEELEGIYKDIWDICPISLSTVPFHAGTKSGAIPKKYWNSNKIFPIGENKMLIKFLRQKIQEGKISIMLHGYSHKDYDNGYEFETGRDLKRKVYEGKQCLEELFQIPITTFVPPHNSLSKQGLEAAIENGLNIVGSFSFHPLRRKFRFSNLKPFAKRKIFFLKEKIKRKSWFFYPYILKLDSHCELQCIGLNLNSMSRLGNLLKVLEWVYEYNGIFCVACHYWELTKGLKRDLIFLFQKAKELDKVEFLSVPEILRNYEN